MAPYFLLACFLNLNKRTPLRLDLNDDGNITNVGRFFGF